MTILGIDTATKQCGIAISSYTQVKILPIEKCILKASVGHSEKILQIIDTLLAITHTNKHHISAVSISQGPGSFTGLRIGMSVAKGLAYSLGVPLLGIGTLDVIGFTHRHRIERVVVAMVSRKDEFYCAEYMEGKRLSKVMVLGLEDLLLRLKEPHLLVTDLDIPRIDDKQEKLEIDPFALNELAFKRIQQNEKDVLHTLSPFYVQGFRGAV